MTFFGDAHPRDASSPDASPLAPAPPRRGLLAVFALFLLGAVARIVALLLFAWPSGAHFTPDLFTIDAVDVPQPGEDPILIDEGRFFLVHLAAGEGTHGGFGDAGFSGLLALSALDPRSVALAHRTNASVSPGDDVPWRPEFLFEGRTGWFRDPRGGSTYTKAGVRVFGPSPHGMTSFAVDVRDDGSVIVDRSKPTTGSDTNPRRTAPYPAS
jgi:hypothetical protein